MPSPPPAGRDHITGTLWFLGGMLITSVVVGAVVLLTQSSDTPAAAAGRPDDPAPVKMVRCPPQTHPETLIRAAACGRTGTVRELLKGGADVAQTDPRADFRGRTALHHAVQRGDEAAVQLLLEAGAATNARDALGDTALHLLALAPEVAHPLYVARFLIDAGADISVRNLAGHTPLETLETDYLRMVEQQDLAQMLLRSQQAAADEANPPAPAIQVTRQDERPAAIASDAVPDAALATEEATPPVAVAQSPLSHAAKITASTEEPPAAALEAIQPSADPQRASQDNLAAVMSPESARESAPVSAEPLTAEHQRETSTEALPASDVPPEPASAAASQASVTAAPVTDSPSEAPSPERDVRARLDAWAKAWSDKEMAAYFDVYAPTFEPPGGLTMDNWRAQREVRIAGKAEAIAVTLSDVDIQHHGDRASVDFTQHYRAGGYTEISRKRLDMTLHDGRWCIVGEHEAG